MNCVAFMLYDVESDSLFAIFNFECDRRRANESSSVLHGVMFCLSRVGY